MRKVTPKILLQPAFYELGSTLGSLCNSISRIVNTAGGISVDSKANLIGKKGANYVFFSGKRRNEKNLSSIAHMTPMIQLKMKNTRNRFVNRSFLCRAAIDVSTKRRCQSGNPRVKINWPEKAIKHSSSLLTFLKLALFFFSFAFHNVVNLSFTELQFEGSCSEWMAVFCENGFSAKWNWKETKCRRLCNTNSLNLLSNYRSHQCSDPKCDPMHNSDVATTIDGLRK